MRLKLFAIFFLAVPLFLSAQDISLLVPGAIKQNNTSDSLYVLSNRAYTKFLKAATGYLYCKKTDSLQKIEISTQKEIKLICDSALGLSQKESKMWYDSLVVSDNKLKACEIDLLKTKECKKKLAVAGGISTLVAITLAILFIIK